MSWQAYVDSNLVGTGKVKKGAIFGAAGGKWACSADFKISDAEAAALTGGFKDPNALRAKGANVEGQRYIVLKADDQSIYAKKGKSGICAVKTSQAVIIGYYDENQQPGAANVTVEALGDYLRESGY